MTRRKLSAISFSFAAAVLVLSERAALSDATLDDVLKDKNKVPQKSAPITPVIMYGPPGPDQVASQSTPFSVIGNSPALNTPRSPAIITDLGTLWDILRTGDPANKRPVFRPVTAANSGAGAAPLFIPTIDPANPGSMWDILRTGDPANKHPVLNPALAMANAIMPAVPTIDPANPGSMWDILRTGDPLNKRPAPMTIADAVRNGQPGINPQTGAPIPPAVIKKPHTGVLGFFDSMGRTFKQVGKTLHSELKITGNKSFGLHNENISGNGQTYSDDLYRGRRSLGGGYDQTDLTITGKVAGLINIETHYNNNLYGNPQDNRISLNYAGKHFQVDAGDINGSITGNSLIDFNRSLKGIHVGTDIMRGVKISTLFSQTKAQARTITINGSNSAGPYYVFAGQIVDGSVRVRVNNRDIDPSEYTIDLYTGQLQFKQGTIIHFDEVIAITFETYGYNQNAGTIMGVRTDFKINKGSKLGLTWLSQSTNQNTGTNEKTELYFGFENPQTPYPLQYPVDMIIVRDAKGNITSATPKYPVTATVDGIPQVYGTDFIVDPLLPNRVFFNRPIASTQHIKITYTPAVSNESPGNRKILGFDTGISLGKVGNIVGEYASSKVNLSGTGVNGSALNLMGNFKFLKDKLNLRMAWKDIDPGFTSIESPGFRLNEKGLTTGLDYAFSSRLKLNMNMQLSKRPSYDYSSIGTGSTSAFAPSKGMDDFTQMTGGLSWSLGSKGTLSLQHNSMETSLYNGGRTKFGTDSFNFNYNFVKGLGMDLSFGQNSNLTSSLTNTTAGGTSGSTSPTLTQYGSSSSTQKLGLHWAANSKFTFNSTLANSQVSGANGQKSDAMDMSFNSEYRPTSKLTFQFGYQVQDSGSFSPYGITGTNTGTTGTTSGTSNPVYAPTRQVYSGGYGDVTGGFGTGLYGGSTYGAGGNYSSGFGGGYTTGIGGYGNYSGGLTSSGFSSFGTSSYGGKSKSFNTAVAYQPAKNLDLRLTWNKSSSEGDLSFNSTSNQLGLTASYNMGERLTLSGTFSNSKMNYLGSTGGTNTNFMFFNVMARPWKRLETNLGYQIMKSSSTASSSSTGTGTGTTFPGGLPAGYGGYGGSGSSIGGFGYGYGATNLSSYNLRLAYPIWRNNKLYTTFENSNTSGYAPSIQRVFTTGIAFELGAGMQLSLGWRSQEHTSLDSSSSSLGTSNLSYRVRSLDADLTMHF